MGLNRFLAPRSAVPISSGLPVPTYSSVTAATHLYQPGSSTTLQPLGNQIQYPHLSGRYDSWPYQNTFTSASALNNPYGYGYYPTGVTGAGPSSHYNGYPYGYPPTQLQWQQPYQSHMYYQPGQSQQPTQLPSVQSAEPSLNGPSSLPPAPLPPPTQPRPPSGLVDKEPTPNGLNILASWQPSQIEELLRNNPQLRDVVIAAINDAKTKVPPSLSV